MKRCKRGGGSVNELKEAEI